MITIRPALAADAALIQQLAHATWYPTYASVLSQEQIDFMLAQSYTVEALQQAMQDGVCFYLIVEEAAALGFMALSKHPTRLRVDKLYVLPGTQGKGLGRKLIDFAASEALRQGLTLLELNVNRYNQAYHFYLKQGFKVVESVDIPYYQFVLNDYIMQKALIA